MAELQLWQVTLPYFPRIAPAPCKNLLFYFVIVLDVKLASYNLLDFDKHRKAALLHHFQKRY
jgi:hypothetical protein